MRFELHVQCERAHQAFVFARFRRRGYRGGAVFDSVVVIAGVASGVRFAHTLDDNVVRLLLFQNLTIGFWVFWLGTPRDVIVCFISRLRDNRTFTPLRSLADRDRRGGGGGASVAARHVPPG